MENDIEYKKFHREARTEEVQDIIERMPTKFGFRISLIVVFIFLLLIIFGWIISYPDIDVGKIVINTAISPIKLVANSSGKLHLNNISSQSSVNEGDVIAYIESTTSYDTLEMIKNILKGYNPSDIDNTSILSSLPPRVAIGGLTSKYYNLLSNLHQLQDFISDGLYDKQISSLRKLLSEQNDEVKNSLDQLGISKKNIDFTHKFYMRDSMLYKDKVVAEADLDKSQLNLLTSKNNYKNEWTNQIEARKQAQQTISKITETDIEKTEKKKELELSVLAAFNDLIDNITLWEQKYLFKAPFKGQIQFLRFWTNDQFIQAGEDVFAIVPNSDDPFGQVYLPAVGAGKVKIGQEVIVKLDDFPYLEYGSIKGKVSAISLTTNTEKTNQGSVETYLVTVKFDKGLMTNYGKKLIFKQESTGSAEIITNDRKLIERLFDNLRYVLKK